LYTLGLCCMRGLGQKFTLFGFEKAASDFTRGKLLAKSLVFSARLKAHNRFVSSGPGRRVTHRRKAHDGRKVS
jgi:hypothetical protein